MGMVTVQRKNAEKRYIDNMLGVNVQQSTDIEVAVDSEVYEAVNADNNEIAGVNKTAETIEDLQCMYQLISISNLKFAVAVSEVTQLLDGDTDIQGNSLTYDGVVFTVIDIATLITPSNSTTEVDQYLLINSSQTAIPCQQLLNIETIEDESVCWRNENSKRLWLAGTVKEKGVAILDNTGLKLTQQHE